MNRVVAPLLAMLTLIFVACDSTPDNVLKPEPMAQLLADLYVADKVVEVNRTMFYPNSDNDSLRKVLKQSILEDHGVTAEMLDSSYMYYGRNLDKYVEVQERVVAILQEKMAHSDAALAMAGTSQAGDSVDTWPGVRQLVLSRRSPQQTVTFSMTPDENWSKGDQYLWSIKSLNMRTPGQWIIAVEYPDGVTEYQNAQFQGEGTNQLRLITDSTRMPLRIYGSLVTYPKEGEIIYLDSISLTRKRVDPTTYRQRSRQASVAARRSVETPAATDDAEPTEAPTHQEAVPTTPQPMLKPGNPHHRNNNAAALAQ